MLSMAETLTDAVPVGWFSIQGDILTWLDQYMRELTGDAFATLDHGTIFDVKRGCS